VSGCLSEFALDRLVAGEVGGAEDERVRAHVGTCDRCRVRLEVRTKERDTFATHGPRFEARRTRRPMRPGVLAAAGALVALAAGVLLFVRTRPVGESLDSTRTKGHSRLGFYVKRGDSVRRGAPGEILHPGDALRFTTTTASRRFVAVLSVDGAGEASVYYPQGPLAVEVEAGEARPLPSATLLDATLGEETLFGIFCDAPVALEPVRAELATGRRDPSVPGCEIDSFRVEKEAPPSP
jgi:Putative zinc-finger